MKVRRCDVCGRDVYSKDEIYRYRLWAIPVKVDNELTTLHALDICETCMMGISKALVRLRKERETDALEIYNPYRPRDKEEPQPSDKAEERKDDAGSEQTVPKVRKRKPKVSPKDGETDRPADNSEV